MTIVLCHSGPLNEQWLARYVPAGCTLISVASAEEIILQDDVRLVIDLDFSPDPRRIEVLRRLLPVPVLINSVSDTLEEIGHPFIRVNGWPGFFEREVQELVFPDDQSAEKIRVLYEELGWKFARAPDTVGMISARILASIINEAYFTLQEQVSTREEIDTAMKLGTNYPMGPFQWSEHIGLEKIHQLLSKLQLTDSRYRVAEALNRMAQDGKKA